jgi:predicted nucleic-acid-binding protein
VIALDTNVLVRLVTKDDIEQTAQAVRLLRGDGPFAISATALLELGWVLGSKRTYNYDRAAISRALHVVASLRNVVLSDPDRVREALTFFDAGHDLGDAFVLASAPSGATVATFDEALVARGGSTTRRVRSVGELAAEQP